MVSLEVPLEVRLALNEACRERRMSLAALVNEALERWLTAEGLNGKESATESGDNRRELARPSGK